MAVKTCDVCRQVFEATNQRKRCSPECWAAADRRRNAAKKRRDAERRAVEAATRPLLTKTCKTCQEPFETDNDRRVYCSEPCKRHAQYQRTERPLKFNKRKPKPVAQIGTHAELREVRAMIYSEVRGERMPGWRRELVVHTCPSCSGHNVEAEQGDYHRERFACWDCEWIGVVAGRMPHRDYRIETGGFLDLSHSPVALLEDVSPWWL